MPLIPNFVVMANSEDLKNKDSRRTQLTKYKTALVYFFGLLILESGNLYKFGAFGLISDQQGNINIVYQQA